MQNQPKPNTMQKTLEHFKILCRVLQDRDNESYPNCKSNNFTDSYELITNPIPLIPPPLGWIDILDDAWNCNIIDDEDYDAYESLMHNHNQHMATKASYDQD